MRSGVLLFLGIETQNTSRGVQNGTNLSDAFYNWGILQQAQRSEIQLLHFSKSIQAHRNILKAMDSLKLLVFCCSDNCF